MLIARRLEYFVKRGESFGVMSKGSKVYSFSSHSRQVPSSHFGDWSNSTLPLRNVGSAFSMIAHPQWPHTAQTQRSIIFCLHFAHDFRKHFFRLTCCASKSVQDMKIPCLSVQQPWASLIMKREKPVENRTWRWMKHHDWDEDGKILLGIQSSTTICTDKNKERRAPGWQADESLQFGMLLGVVDLVRICPPNELTAVQRKHYIKQKGPETWCWVLENPRPFAPPIKKSGQSSLFYPELEESDLLSVLPVEQSGVATDFRYLTVTDANLRNNSLCVTGAQGLFPKAIYRASSKKLKYRVYVLWENQVIDTDIDSEKNIFRSRKWHAFFDFNRVQAGDQILLERLEPYLYRVSKSPRS